MFALMGHERIKDRIIYNIDGLIAAVEIKGDSISYGQSTTSSGLRRKIFDQLVCNNSYEPFLHTTTKKNDEIVSAVLVEYLETLKNDVMNLNDWGEITERIYICEGELFRLPIKKNKRRWY
jgi:hypothetical protein